MRLPWVGSMVTALGISILAPTVARACEVRTVYDLESEVDRANIVIKARMTGVDLADVVAKNRPDAGKALAMSLETIRTYKGIRRSAWQVVLREVPTDGDSDLARWRERIGMTKIFALKTPFRDRDDDDWTAYWGAVPDGAGGVLYQIVSPPCAGNVIVEPDLKTELRIAFIAQRELIIATCVALAAGIAALVWRNRRKTPPPGQAA